MVLDGEGRNRRDKRPKKGSRWGDIRVGCILCVSSLSECAYNTKIKEITKVWAENYGWARGTPEKAMATHSSVLAWRIPGTVRPGGLPSMGSHRVGHD